MALPVISPSFHLDDIADDDDNNFGVERDLLKSSTRLTTVFVATKLQPTGVQFTMVGSENGPRSERARYALFAFSPSPAVGSPV